MFVASLKRKENIAEYLLYMWQIEDIIRANGLDIDKIKENVISKYSSITDEQRKDLTGWYESLIDMMRREGIVTVGHLQINQNVISELTELHNELLAEPKYSEYSSLYYRTLPYIVELRSRARGMVEDEITTCFTALYGLLLLRLQNKELSSDTQAAMNEISRFVATLSAYFHKNEVTPLFVKE